MFSVIFPGQGSQSVGMAKDLYSKFNIVKELFEQADEILKISISKLIKYISDPVGGIKYSVKRLRKDRSTKNSKKKYTNANGMVMYQQCESPCM